MLRTDPQSGLPLSKNQNEPLTAAGTTGAILHRARVLPVGVKSSSNSNLLHVSAFSGRVSVKHGGSHTSGDPLHCPTMHCSSSNDQNDERLTANPQRLHRKHLQGPYSKCCCARNPDVGRVAGLGASCVVTNLRRVTRPNQRGSIGCNRWAVNCTSQQHINPIQEGSSQRRRLQKYLSSKYDWSSFTSVWLFHSTTPKRRTSNKESS
jgi:hypothetical protein